VLGALPNLTRAVAIVGTRAASEHAMEFASELAQQLAQCGVTIVSGGALGIDGAAHRGALHGSGATLAVLASSLTTPYPAAHRKLFQEICVQGGALLREEDCASVQGAAAFLWRNRIIAALSQAVVVIQAPARSGALSTSRWATSMSIPVLAVPGPPWDPRFTGSNLLLRKAATLCEHADDVLAALGTAAKPKRNRLRKAAIPLTPLQRELLSMLSGEVRSSDQLIRDSGLPAAKVQLTLLELRLLGVVAMTPDGHFRSIRT